MNAWLPGIEAHRAQDCYRGPQTLLCEWRKICEPRYGVVDLIGDVQLDVTKVALACVAITEMHLSPVGRDKNLCVQRAQVDKRFISAKTEAFADTKRGMGLSPTEEEGVARFDQHHTATAAEHSTVGSAQGRLEKDVEVAVQDFI